MPCEREVEINDLKTIDLRDGIIIDGFPSIGLVGSIVSNYLINITELPQIGIMDSPDFPTISLIRNKEPNNPVRVYGGRIERDGEDDLKLAIFVSEFQPSSGLIKSIANSVLDWAQAQMASLIVSPEGLAVEDMVVPSSKGQDKLDVYAVGSTMHARLYFEPYDEIKPFDEGVISGVAGVLLNEGKKRGFDVISILAEAHEAYPDAKAAARVIEALDTSILHLGIDTQPLYEQAEIIEDSIRKFQQQKEAAEKRRASSANPPSIYG